MSEEPNVVNVSEMIQSITAAAAPTTTFAAPSDANETVGVYTTICSIAKKVIRCVLCLFISFRAKIYLCCFPS